MLATAPARSSYSFFRSSTDCFFGLDILPSFVGDPASDDFSSQDCIRCSRAGDGALGFGRYEGALPGPLSTRDVVV